MFRDCNYIREADGTAFPYEYCKLSRQRVNCWGDKDCCQHKKLLDLKEADERVKNGT